MNLDSETEFIILLSISFITAAISLWSRFMPVWHAGNAVKKTTSTCEYDESVTAETNCDSDRMPKVSVVVYAFTEEEETRKYLQMAMNQDYPDYEVILVNEGGAETTADLAECLKAVYPEGLYVTFIPDESRNLSRRKLAQTVGIKAATGEFIVTTTSNCTIPSRNWLSDLMRPFVEDSAVDVSLGYSYIDFSTLRGAGKWYRQMNALLTSCQWIGAAYNGHPFRGDSNNLAFRRSLFFEKKGYAKTIHLVNGDDDLFLREIMNPDNTRIAISSDSILVTEWGDSANRILADIRERYQFTSRFLPKWPFLRYGLGSLTQWAMVISALAAAIAGLTANTILPAIVAFTIININWMTEILIYRRTARRLGSVCLWWSLPWFLLWHPFGNLIFKIKCRRRIRKNYTFS